MSNGFYFDNHTGSVGGGGLSRVEYSVEEQGQDAWIAMARARVANEKTAQAYREHGIWYPQEVPTDPVERNGGVLVRTVL